MACQLATVNAVNLAQFERRIRAANAPHIHFRTKLFDILAHGFRCADILQHIAFQAFFLKEIVRHQADNQVGADEATLLVDEHHAVGIAVVDNAHIGFLALHKCLNVSAVSFDERIRLVVWEGAVECVVDVSRRIS